MKYEWLAIAALPLLAACGGAAPTTDAKTPEAGPLSGELVDSDGKPAPKWVTAPARYKKDDDGNKVVCGEGSVGGTANMNMAQTASAGRARTALARALEVKVKSMLKDYQSTTTGGAQFKTAANDEQHIVDASKQITDVTLSGTEVTDTWVARTSTMHALVCLNVDKFKGLVSGMHQLDEQVRQAVVQRAEKAWDELDEAPSPGAPVAQQPPPAGPARPEQMSATAPSSLPGSTPESLPPAYQPQAPVGPQAPVVAPPSDSWRTGLYERASRSVVVVTAGGGAMVNLGAGSLVGPHTILTNFHVVSKDGRLIPTVKIFMKPANMLSGNLERDLKNPIVGTVAKTNPGWDLALVELASSQADYPIMPIATAPTALGEKTIAIGHPVDGGAWSVTTGIVSNRLADFEQSAGKNVYQIQTPINPGNSGGPLLNDKGELIGVTTSGVRIGKGGGVTEGIQFAVASDVVRRFLGPSFAGASVPASQGPTGVVSPGGPSSLGARSMPSGVKTIASYTARSACESVPCTMGDEFVCQTTKSGAQTLAAQSGRAGCVLGSRTGERYGACDCQGGAGSTPRECKVTLYVTCE